MEGRTPSKVTRASNILYKYDDIVRAANITSEIAELKDKELLR